MNSMHKGLGSSPQHDAEPTHQRGQYSKAAQGDNGTDAERQPETPARMQEGESQIMASTVTRGSAAISAPSLSLRLATSDISTTRAAVMAYLVIIHVIVVTSAMAC